MSAWKGEPTRFSLHFVKQIVFGLMWISQYSTDGLVVDDFPKRFKLLIDCLMQELAIKNLKLGKIAFLIF